MSRQMGEAVAAEAAIEVPPGGSVAESVDPAGVARARERAPSEAALAAVTAMFKLLGDPTRVRLLHALRTAGELCVGDLAAATGTAETTASQALRLLRTAGVVAARRDGRQVYYRLADDHVRMLLELSSEHVGHPPDRAVGGPS